MILAVDLGRAKTGLATSEGSLASPLKTISHKSISEIVKKVLIEISTFNVEKIIIGYAPGKNENYFVKFGKNIKDFNPNIEVVLWDETLTTRQARETMIKQNLPKKKRKEKEHEIAASLILQSYLDSQND